MRTTVILSLIAFVVAAGPTRGQDAILSRCAAGETVEQCINNALSTPAPAGRLRVVGRQPAAVNNVLAGASEAAEDGRQFRLVKSAEDANVSSAAGTGLEDMLSLISSSTDLFKLAKGEETLNLDWNIPGFENSPWKPKLLTAIRNRPTVFDPLRKKLEDSLDGGEIETLEDDLDSLDDLEWKFTLAWNGANERRLLRRTMRRLSDQQRAQIANAADFSLNPLVVQTTAERQFTLNVGYHSRRGLAGPDEFSATLKGSLKIGDDRASQLTVSGDYTHSKEFIAPVSGLPESFREPEAESTAINVVFSRPLTLNVGDTGSARTDFELTGSYEDVSGDPNKNNRAIVSALIIHEVSDSTKLEAGLVWASKPEYLADVDEEVSARLGLRFRRRNAEKEERIRNRAGL